jgi:hypothetical protein
MNLRSENTKGSGKTMNKNKTEHTVLILPESVHLFE